MTPRTFVAFAAILALSASSLSAQLLDTGLGGSTTNRGANSGPGQGVFVSTGVQLTQFGFYLGSGGGDVKFMIWNSDHSSLVFSQVLNLGATATGTLVLTNPFAFFLGAGSTYYFGVISNAELQVSFFFPPNLLSSNGLTLVNDNTNYADFDNPARGGDGSASIALALYGESDLAVVPEPATMVLTATGLVSLIGFRRLGRRKQAVA